MNDGHNWMIKLVTSLICALPQPKHLPYSKNQFIMMLQIFLGIFNQKRGTLLDKVDKSSCPLNLSNKRTCFWLKLIQLLCLSRKQLTRLLINIRSKIWSLRKAEKTCKRRWLVKRAKNEFNVNPYKAGKNLFDPKCYSSLNVDQETLDQQQKSSNLIDKNYDIPSANLEGLPPELLLLKKFNKSCFCFDNYFGNLSSHRIASAPSLNGIPYKVHKKYPKISRFLFKIFKTCFKRHEIPIQW